MGAFAGVELIGPFLGVHHRADERSAFFAEVPERQQAQAVAGGADFLVHLEAALHGRHVVAGQRLFEPEIDMHRMLFVRRGEGGNGKGQRRCGGEY